jgi:hypothetical protein
MDWMDCGWSQLTRIRDLAPAISMLVSGSTSRSLPSAPSKSLVVAVIPCRSVDSVDSVATLDYACHHEESYARRDDQKLNSSAVV